MIVLYFSAHTIMQIILLLKACVKQFEQLFHSISGVVMYSCPQHTEFASQLQGI